VPGKHAPESPASFYLSVGRAVGGALVVLGIVVVIALAATGSNKKTPTATKPPKPRTTATTTHAASPSATASPSPSQRAPADITVNVLNGTGRSGLAKRVAGTLKDDGYDVKTVANAPQLQGTTTIYYRAGHGAEAQALLRQHPELGKIAPATSTTPTNAFITVILGNDYPVS
jgi:maltose-binding protein MalE